MPLPQEFLYQLKQANPIDSVMGRYVELKRAGSLLKCCCPFHSEKTPSCVVYAGTQDPHFYCFGCHVGGDVVTFLMKIEGLSYHDAIQMLAENAGMTVPTAENDHGESQKRMRLMELNRNAAKYYYEQLCGADKRGLQYLSERKLKPEIVRKYGLGFAGESWDGLSKAMHALGYSDEELLAVNLCSVSRKTGALYDRFRNRVIFPIFDLRGNVIAFGGRTIEKDGEPKYLNSSDTPVFKKGRNLFSMHFAKKSQSKRLILAEGYMDVIAIHQAGFENVVASLGTALTAEQCRLMRQYCEEVVISYDSDAAGQNATAKAVNLLRAVGIQPKILHMHDAKDPDEYIKKFGAGRFRLLLEEADDAVNFALERCKNGVDASTENGTITALHKAVSVLAAIENELDRNVYLSRVAKEYNVDQQILQAQVDKERRRNVRSEKKQTWRAITTQPLLRDTVNPVSTEHRREAKAEEEILCYLFRNPDAAEAMEARIQPSDFVTPLYQRVYDTFLQAMKNGEPFSLSLFSESFSPDEMGRIAGISAMHQEIVISEKAIADCIHLLKRYHLQQQGDAAEQSDDEWLSSFRMRNADKL